jgi:uncharacterized protein
MTSTLKHPKWPELRGVLESLGGCVVAVSGGVDSLLLATLAHDSLPGKAMMAHCVSPAVPEADTQRVREQAARQNWNLMVVTSGEFEDERYLLNPYDRCYFCKSHLYDILRPLAEEAASRLGLIPMVLSGANVDDLGEHRPGLIAAKEHGVRHPFVEAGMAKSDIRAMARELNLAFADLPASPCLSSRIYTGTRVTPERLEAVAFAEKYLKNRLNIPVVRCRINQDQMMIEFEPHCLPSAGDRIAAQLQSLLFERFSCVTKVSIDPHGYSPGRAFRKS